jgi:predicted metal-dependent hydrolase
VLFDWLNSWPRRPQKAPDFLELGSRQVPLKVTRHPQARRYLLRLQPNGTVRLTLPRGGSATAAWQFLERHRPWLEEQFQKWLARPRQPVDWQIGSPVLFRGEICHIQSLTLGQICFGGEILSVNDNTGNLRPTVEKHLRKMAARELPVRVLELAKQHGFSINRVTVRNQRTRWGSCSRQGNISLNWRLIQTPDFVRDYIILHELAHLRQMNHSKQFWDEVERLCPDYRTAERWLKQQNGWLRQQVDFY